MAKFGWCLDGHHSRCSKVFVQYNLNCNCNCHEEKEE